MLKLREYRKRGQMWSVRANVVSEGECGHLIFSDQSKKDPYFTLKSSLSHEVDFVSYNGLGHFVVKIEIFG